jgi:heterodisulfide reductase subunit A
VEGEEGDFTVALHQSPRHVNVDKCIACGLCAEKCPRKVDDEYNENLAKRKAIYVQYPQAVPLKYAIDERYCIFFEKGKCRACEKFCPSGAINFDEKESDLTVHVGSIILAPGFETFDPAVYDTYGYKKSPDIVTSIEFERILASTGPTGGHLHRLSDQKEPSKIAWLQCIGSRDVHAGANPYCSAVCCTHAIKEAMIAKDHMKGALDAAIFYIDVRTTGKDFERYYNRAKDAMGVRFIKSKITTIDADSDSGNLFIRYTDEEGKRAEEAFDMVVLSVGFSIPRELRGLAGILDVDLDSDSFPVTGSFSPVQSSRPGIFTAGAFHAPQDIPSSVTDASAAAAQAGALLSQARFSLSKRKELPPELPHTGIRGARPRVGVFVCDCGTNIAGVVDVPQVARYAETLPFVEYVAENLFSCSQDTQEAITAAIAEQKLNRVVVASCTPQTHEPLFQETVRSAGINKYLFEMANIRNQCSWVHADYPEAATEKAKDLVRMAVEKVVRLEPLTETELAVTQAALVIGGGLAGMAAAKNLADQGYPTYLIEKAGSLGGNALRLFQTWRREDIRTRTQGLIDEITAHERIEVITNAEITSVEGFVGNFKTTITADGKERTLAHGVTVIATGAAELTPTEYLYGQDPRVVTSLELDEMLAAGDPRLGEIKTCVFIQCVGSRIPERPYCSRVCCTHSVMSALHLKERNPKRKVFVLYRDMRTYGLREHVYQEAREKGVVFIRYELEEKPEIRLDGERIVMNAKDPALGEELEINPDLVVLAAAMVRDKEDRLSQLFKVPVNEDGFFVEAHVKLRPVDFATDGVFFCGLAHSPQAIDESIAQAQAASSRAVTVLSQTTIHSSGIVAVVNPLWCSSCGVCMAICPYGAPSFNEKGIAEINPVLCKGCGLCTASCRSGAIHLNGFDEGQIMAMIGTI